MLYVGHEDVPLFVAVEFYAGHDEHMIIHSHQLLLKDFSYNTMKISSIHLQ